MEKGPTGSIEMEHTHCEIPEVGVFSGDEFITYCETLEAARVNAGIPYDNVRTDLSAGFIVEEEQAGLKLGIPCSNVNQEEPLVCYFGAAEVSGQKQKLRTPTVMPKPLTDKSKNPENFEYLLFTYKPIQPEEKDLENTEFIFSGCKEEIRKSFIVSDTFIPLQALRDRIGLNANPEHRKQLYALDWLTFLGHTKTFQDLPLPANYEGKVEEWRNSKQAANLAKYFNGSHLWTSNNVGQMDPTHTINFIDHLFRPKNDDKPKKNGDPDELVRYIFRRWCGLAYCAALAQKERYSVNARFWKVPQNPKIEFVFAINPAIKGIVRQADFVNEAGNAGINPEDVTSGGKTCFWYQVIQGAVDTAAAGTGHFHGRVIAPMEDLEDGLLLFGRHPQGFYDVYLSKENFQDMWKHNRPPPYLEERIPQFTTKFKEYTKAVNTRISEDPANDTKTTITFSTVTMASQNPRCKTQNAVMGGYGAGEVALALWNVGDKHCAEWLHRSAYSFGGLHNEQGDYGNPDLSQTPGNLVFGTYECNTAMIRYESYLKRLAKAKVQVELRTKTHCEELGYPPWIAQKLEYIWKFKWGVKAKKTNIFDLFTLRAPSLFEVRVDEEFDKIWLKGSSEGVRKMIEFFLLCSSHLGANA